MTLALLDKTGHQQSHFVILIKKMHERQAQIDQTFPFSEWPIWTTRGRAKWKRAESKR